MGARVGRRNLQVGDVVAVDTPLLNGVATIIGGPDTERGTKVLPKWGFEFVRGIVFDPMQDNYVGDMAGQIVWMEDNPDYVSIIQGGE